MRAGYLAVAAAVILWGCSGSKTNGTTGGSNGSTGGSTGGTAQAVTTAVGMPVAGQRMAQATIDASGSTLTSSDGQFTLTVPAGALSSATQISIQAITDTIPGGLGWAYRLLPEGTTFAQPVTLSLKPTYGQFDGTTLAHVNLAYQDAQGRWPIIGKVTQNADGSVSATTTHFTDYAFFADMFIQGSGVSFVNGSIIFKVTLANAYTDPSTGMTFAAGLVDPILTGNADWAVNGDRVGDPTNSGTISPTGPNVAGYTGPSQFPSTDPVSVSASFTLGDGSTESLVTNVYILAHKYDLKVTLESNEVCAAGTAFSSDFVTSDSIEVDLDDGFNATPGAAETGVDGLAAGTQVTSCTQGCSATFNSGETNPLTLAGLKGGWDDFQHRLWLAPSGTTNVTPALDIDCGGSTHTDSSGPGTWNPGSLYGGYFEGMNQQSETQSTNVTSSVDGVTMELDMKEP